MPAVSYRIELRRRVERAATGFVASFAVAVATIGGIEDPPGTEAGLARGA